jgi:hypothetical protein
MVSNQNGTYSESVGVARAWNDGTLSNHWSTIIGIVAFLQQTVPMNGHGLISKLVIYVHHDVVAYVANNSWSRPFAIDRNYWSHSKSALERTFKMEELPNGFAIWICVNPTDIPIISSSNSLHRSANKKSKKHRKFEHFE